MHLTLCLCQYFMRKGVSAIKVCTSDLLPLSVSHAREIFSYQGSLSDPSPLSVSHAGESLTYQGSRIRVSPTKIHALRVLLIKFHAFNLLPLPHPSCLQVSHKVESFSYSLLSTTVGLRLIRRLQYVLPRPTVYYHWSSPCSPTSVIYPGIQLYFFLYDRPGCHLMWGEHQLPATEPSLLLSYLCSSFHHLYRGRGLPATFA